MDKNVLKKFAIESRQELMEKVANKINRYFVDEEFNVNQNGEVYVLVNDKHTLRLTKSEYENRQLLVKRIKEITLEQVIEEAAYTWFNRIIAIRYMEIHDYLPLTKDNQSLGVRVLSSKDNTPDPEIMKISNLINPDLDIEFNKEYYGTIQDNNKRFEYILLLICKKLGKVIPQVFDGITDYIDILIPENMLNESGYITKLLVDVSVDNFERVEIIGWLYQYYNTDIFNQIYDGDMTKKKIDAKYLPAATQLFTPEWVVNYMIENSLGKYWIEHSEQGNKLKNNWKYYVSTIENKGNNNNVENIKFLDPSSGSGHMLIYAFELFYQMYEQSGYNKSKISELILRKNIYGLDIDNRAGQLTILSVLLKAREYDRNIFNNKVIKELNIQSIYDCKNINRESLNILYEKTGLSDDEKMSVKEIIDYLYKTFFEAKEYGSILKVESHNYEKVIELYNEIKDMQNNIFEIEMIKEVEERFIPIIKQAIILSNKYEIIVTNPPYLSFGRMNAKLSNYIKENYVDAKSDLAVVFIDKAINYMCKENGYISFVTTKSWMYLQSFEEFRKRIVHNKQFDTIVDFGTELFDGKIGHLPIIAWVNKNQIPSYKLTAIKLSDFCYSRRDEKQKEIFNKNNYYNIEQKSMECIEGSPIAYWITEQIQKAFENQKVGDLFQAKQGMTTGNNNLFLRLWYEVNNNNIEFNADSKKGALESKKRWFPYNKGGDYRKWYGNREYVVNWFNDGEELKEYTSKLPQGTAVRLKSQDYYFKEGITWSFIGSRFAARYSPVGSIFDVGGSSIFPEFDKEYLLSFFNSNIADNFLKIINPTMNYQIKDIRLLPYIKNEEYVPKIKELYNECLKVSKEDWDTDETSWDFKCHPLISQKQNGNNQLISNVFENWKIVANERFDKLKKNEEELNDVFLNIYNLDNEVSKNVEDKDVTIKKADREREIKSLISYAVGCMFGRYSLNKDGLVYAGGRFESVFEKYKGQNLVDENGQPLPGNNGGWAGVSLADYKYISDGEKEIELSYSPDIDNIIPITENNYFGDDVVSRFKKFIEVVYGKETLYDNLEFIAETLGKKNGENSEETIRRYFINDFYNDHIKMYQKRPIYWLFDSGKKNGFKCLIYMHRYNEGIVSKIRLDYLHRMQNTYEKELKEIADKLNGDVDLTSKRELSKRQADISAKLQETNEYDEKISHIADQKIKIDLDDGVVVNYAKFSVKNPKTGKDESILAKIK